MTSVHSREVKSVEQIDAERKQRKAIEYLDKIEEARRWVEHILVSNDIDPLEKNDENSENSLQKNFELSLQKSENLAELANCLTKNKNFPVFKHKKKKYQHTDNINFFRKYAKNMGVPKIYFFDTLDCYNGKNMQDVIFFIHVVANYSNLKYKTDKIKKIGNEYVEYSQKDIIEKIEIVDELPQFESLQEDIISNLSSDSLTNNTDTHTLINNNTDIVINNNDNIISIDYVKKCDNCPHFNNCTKCFCDCQLNCIDICNCGNKTEKNCTECQSKKDSVEKQTIRNVFRAFIYNSAFNSIIYKKTPTLFAVKQILKIFSENAQFYSMEAFGESIHNNIHNLKSKIFQLEKKSENNNIYTTLLINNLFKNKSLEKKTTSVDKKQPKEYENFQKLFYLMNTEPSVFACMLYKRITQCIEEEKESFEIETVIENYVKHKILPLFSYKNKVRDENLIVKFIDEFSFILNNTEDKEVEFYFSYCLNYLITLNLTTSKNLNRILAEFTISIEKLEEYFNTEDSNVSVLNEAAYLLIKAFKRAIPLLPYSARYYFGTTNCNFTFLYQNILIPILKLSEKTKNFDFTDKKLGEVFEQNTERIELDDVFDFIMEETNEKFGSNIVSPAIKIETLECNTLLKEAKNLLTDVKSLKPITKNVNNFKNIRKCLAEITNKTVEINSTETFIQITLNNPVNVDKALKEVSETKKKLCVAAHLPGINLFDSLTNDSWEDERGSLEFQLVHALFFCPIFSDVVNHRNYNRMETFEDNYQKLSTQILKVYENEQDRYNFNKVKYEPPTVRDFKNNLLELLQKLTVDRQNGYDELLNVVIDEATNLKLRSISKAKEFSLKLGMFNGYRVRYLQEFEKYEISKAYIKSYMEKMMAKTTESFKYSVDNMVDSGVLKNLSDYDINNKENNLSGICFILKSLEAGVFSLEMCILDICVARTQYKLHELLYQSYEGVESVCFENVDSKVSMGEVYTLKLVELINKKFIRK